MPIGKFLIHQTKSYFDGVSIGEEDEHKIKEFHFKKFSVTKKIADEVIKKLGPMSTEIYNPEI